MILLARIKTFLKHRCIHIIFFLTFVIVKWDLFVNQFESKYQQYRTHTISLKRDNNDNNSYYIANDTTKNTTSYIVSQHTTKSSISSSSSSTTTNESILTNNINSNNETIENDNTLLDDKQDKETTTTETNHKKTKKKKKDDTKNSNNNNNIKMNAVVKVDYKDTDYRAFIFTLHEEYGLMLLYCTRKKNKGPHWQLPGGHVDDEEFIRAAEESDDYSTQLTLATKRGAARELFEETGIDVRFSLERLNPAGLRATPQINKKSKHPILVNEYKHRLFYFLMVNDTDFFPDGTTKANGTINLKLKLSVEHTGFTFQPEPMKAAEMLEKHSGGKVSEALRMSMSASSLGPLSPQKPSGMTNVINNETISSNNQIPPIPFDTETNKSNTTQSTVDDDNDDDENNDSDNNDDNDRKLASAADTVSKVSEPNASNGVDRSTQQQQQNQADNDTNRELDPLLLLPPPPEKNKKFLCCIFGC